MGGCGGSVVGVEGVVGVVGALCGRWAVGVWLSVWVRVKCGLDLGLGVGVVGRVSVAGIVLLIFYKIIKLVWRVVW